MGLIPPEHAIYAFSFNVDGDLVESSSEQSLDVRAILRYCRSSVAAQRQLAWRLLGRLLIRIKIPKGEFSTIGFDYFFETINLAVWIREGLLMEHSLGVLVMLIDAIWIALSSFDETSTKKEERDVMIGQSLQLCGIRETLLWLLKIRPDLPKEAVQRMQWAVNQLAEASSDQIPESLR